MRWRYAPSNSLAAATVDGPVVRGPLDGCHSPDPANDECVRRDAEEASSVVQPPGACRDAWDEILVHQLDYRYRPCNFVEIMPRLDEHLRRAKAKGATV